MKKFFTSLCVAFFIGILYISPTNALDLEKINMDVHVRSDGSAHIVEKWNIDVDEGTEIYKVYENMGKSKISHLKVEDENGYRYRDIGRWDIDASKEEKDGRSGLVVDGDHYEICFGIGDYGQREYTFSYDISHFIKEYEDAQGIHFGFFSNMALEPRDVTIRLDSDFPIDDAHNDIWGFGYHGDVQFDDHGIVMQTNSRLSQDQSMVLLMRFEPGLFSNPEVIHRSFEEVYDDAMSGSDYDDSFDPRARIFVWIGIVCLVTVLMTVIVTAITHTSKKASTDCTFDDGIPLRPSKDIPMFRELPCHHDIFLFYYLARKCHLIGNDDKDGLIAAILLKWVREGKIHLEKVNYKVLFFNRERSEFDFQSIHQVENSLERQLLDMIKKASGENLKLEEGELSDWFGEHYSKIDSWFDFIDDVVENQLRQEKLLKLEVTEHRFLGIKYHKDHDVYHASLREEMEHIIGMKRFLEDMSLIHEKEMIEVTIWEDYLIFAAILGIADKVQKQIGEVCPQFEDVSSINSFDTYYIARSFARSSVSAMQSSRSSGSGGSSSFGGGGSFSGGGGGGVR